MSYRTCHTERLIGLEKIENDVIFAGPLAKADKNVIFFGGDVQVKVKLKQQM